MKKLLSIFGVSLIALSATSCHGRLVPTETTGTTVPTLPPVEVKYPDTFDASKEYNITFWAKNDSRNDQLEVYKNAITSFESIYPNIHVELKNYTDYNLIYNDVLINIPTNTTPNVCIAYPDHVATYMEGSNVVADLDQLINNESYGLGGKDLKFESVKKDEIYPKFFEEGLINNKHSVLPFVRSSEALYINKEAIEKLGFPIPDVPTWDWVWKVCEKSLSIENRIKFIAANLNFEEVVLTYDWAFNLFKKSYEANHDEKKDSPFKYNNIDEFISDNELAKDSSISWNWIWQVLQNSKIKEYLRNQEDLVFYPLIYKSTDNMFISMKKQQNKPFTENGKVKYLNDDTKNMLVDLYNKAEKGLYSTFKLVSYPANFLNKWQAVMAVDSTAGATWMGYGASTHDAGSKAEGEPFETVVRPIPQYDINNPKMISQGPSICVFGKDNPDEVVASWLFAQFLLTNDVQIAYAKTEGYIPVTSKATSSEAYKSYLANPNENKVKIAASKLVVDNINNTFITEVYSGSTYARSAASYLIEAVAVKNSSYKTFADMEELFKRAIRFNNLADYI